MIHHLLALGAGGVAGDIGRSVKAAFFMFYDTAWALIGGFALSGAVQSFVSRRAIERRLGNHRPAAVARAGLFGIASSSCSYAASATARALVTKGADFLTSMVFMFASTNLVIELGIVLAVLIGWQFVAAEFVGGVIMIVLLVVIGAVVFTGRELATIPQRQVPEVDIERVSSTRPRWLTRSGWADAAGYTVADLTMLRRELLIGFVAAGFLATLVPISAWNELFLRGHGIWTTLENAAVGPLLAAISCVCSIGNVPLAAALWHGGISFGGVVSFVFADLLALPIVAIYTKLYGKRMTIRLVGVFWLVMSLAGLATEGLFHAAGIAPPTRHGAVVPEHLALGTTAIADLAVVVGFIALYLFTRQRSAGDATTAIDPVCHMQVERANAPATYDHEGTTYYFCSEHCRERFRRDVGRNGAPTDEHDDNAEPPGEAARDLVCGMVVDPHIAIKRQYHGMEYFFCSLGCATAFDDDPDRYREVQPEFHRVELGPRRDQHRRR